MNRHAPAVPESACAPRPAAGRTSAAILALTLFALVLTQARPAQGQVVINEIMYHPPDDRDEMQWVELHNSGSAPVNLGGWSFTKGFKFTFAKNQTIPAGGYLVVCRDLGGFRIQYGTNIPMAGEFTGKLSHGGETLELSDAKGQRVDAVKFDDKEPWPVSPDGMSASLERILPSFSGDLPHNWAPSILPLSPGPAGSPGQKNSAAATNLPPVIANVMFRLPIPGQPTSVKAEIADPDGLRTVTLSYQALDTASAAQRPSSQKPPVPWKEVVMQRTGDDAKKGNFGADIPALPAGQLLRFRITAIDETGATRHQPHPSDARPTYSAYVGTNVNAALIPSISLFEFGPVELPGRSLRNSFGGPRPGRRGPQTLEPVRGAACLVYMPPGGGPVQTFDHIRVTPRRGGWKVRLQKDQPLQEMTTINVIFEYESRFVLAEHLSYELYRKAGSPAPLSGHWRVFHNGRPVGYHLFVEQPNNSFLRRVGRKAEGDVYKLLWYESDIVSQHEKKNNPETGHTELVGLIEALQRSSGEKQWQLIQQRLNVESFVNYYAVNMCIQNWDGFFNNYFLYRAPGPAGKWEIIPWDEDKTWGDYDGCSPKYDWYSMPLTTGMNGDRPKSSLLGGFEQGGIHGGPSWWRHPGWFSGPLLANPTFRAKFRARLRELCETTFTPAQWEPVFAQLERQLEPEVRFRAGQFRGGPGEDDPALSAFKLHMDSFRRQVVHRRAFILKELAKEE